MKNNNLGLPAIILLSIIPAIMLLIASPRLDSYENITHALGQITALIGMTLFAITFILSTRMGFLERIFGGLDKVYRIHSFVGASAFILLLFHPLLLVMKYIPDNLGLAAKYILPGGHLSVDLGIIALTGMIILLSITLYMKMKYNRWKFSHEFLGIFFMVAVFHIFMVRGTVSRDDIFPGYPIYALIVSAIGILGFIYSLMIRRMFCSRYEVKSVSCMNSCFDIVLRPLGKPKRYNSGQFMFLKFYSKGLSHESHPFSIASGSNDENIRFIIKKLGDFTGMLENVKEKDIVLVEGPYGSFNRNSRREQVWIAGGIGITPFIGMAKDLSGARVDLYYSARFEGEFVALEDFGKIAEKNRNFRIHTWNSSEKGKITIKDMAYGKDKEFYICGPPEMKNALKKVLIESGIEDNHIVEEDFGFK